MVAKRSTPGGRGSSLLAVLRVVASGASLAGQVMDVGVWPTALAVVVSALLTGWEHAREGSRRHGAMQREQRRRSPEAARRETSDRS